MPLMLAFPLKPVKEGMSEGTSRQVRCGIFSSILFCTTAGLVKDEKVGQECHLSHLFIYLKVA